MRLSLAIFATYLATITVAIPTTPVADSGTLSSSKPMDNLIFAYGGGRPFPNEKREEQKNEKRCDITDLECWQHGGHAVERGESESGPV